MPMHTYKNPRLRFFRRRGFDYALRLFGVVNAVHVLDELKKLGRRVPDEISVAGFGDTDYYSTLFELTSVRQPMAEIGRRAVEILLGRRRAVCQEFLPCEPVLRRSCRTPGGIGG